MITFKYRFLSIIRKKALIFWNLIFPLVLTTFFGLTLPNAYDTITFETIPIAVVENNSSDTTLQATLTSIEEMKTPLFQITYTSLQEAKNLLKEGAIDGIIEQDTYQVYVKAKGINQTILQSFMDEYLQQKSMINNFIEQDVSIDEVMASMHTTNDYINSQTNENSSVTSVYFYAILAMCCLYGGFISLNCISSLQANQSDLGARNSMAPQTKAKMLMNDFIISYFIDFIILMFLLVYMMLVIQIDFGEHLGYIIGSLMVGVLAGNSIGLLIGVAFEKKLDMKIGIITAVTLLLSSLSGMMFVQMKYFVETYVPFLARINPANMITDALYSLYYYGPKERYILNIISLLIFTGICYIVSFAIIRRKSYANI